MIDWDNKSKPLFAVIIFVLALAVIAVPLRCVLRIYRKAFKIDDWLILAALIFHTAACSAALWGLFYGLDVKDSHLTLDELEKGTQAFVMFKTMYVVATCLIKCSVCFTFLRLAISRKIRLSLYVILGAVIASSAIMFMGSFIYCLPFHAIWTRWKQPGAKFHCLPDAAVLSFAYVFASVTIITDLCCATIPGVMLWDSTMPRRTKIMAYATLSLGALAGFATVCRLPYIMYWVGHRDRGYGLGRIVLFELLESGLGIFASCAPALKPVFSRGLSAFSSLLVSISSWASLESYENTFEKSSSRRSVPPPPPPPLPVLDLLIPDLDDPDAEQEISGRGKDETGKNSMRLPTIVVHEYKTGASNGAKYTEGWDIV